MYIKTCLVKMHALFRKHTTSCWNKPTWFNNFYIIKKVKWSRYRPGVAQRLGRGIALLFHERGTKKGWVVSSTPRPHFTPGKNPVLILQEAGWAPGPVWTGGNFRPHRHSIPDRPACSSVAIPTELPGPQFYIIIRIKPQICLVHSGKIKVRHSAFEITKAL